MVKFLKYKNKNYPVRVSYSAILKVKQELGKDLESFDLEFLEPLLYYGLISGHEAEDMQMTIEREKIQFMLDEVLSEFVKMLPDFFAEIKMNNSENGEESKKK